MRTSLLFIATACLAGCGYTAKGYRYQGQALAPREENCPLEIFTTPPKAKTMELGVVEFKRRSLGRLPKTEHEALAEVNAFACMAGGNGIMVMPNRDGRYTKAVILQIRKKGEGSRAD